MKFGKTSKVKITNSLKMQCFTREKHRQSVDGHTTANRHEQIDRARKTAQ